MKRFESILTLVCVVCVVSLSICSVSADTNTRIDRHCRQVKKDLKMAPRKKKIIRNQEGKWWMWYWDPNWSCPTEEKIGLPTSDRSQDGEKWVCDTDLLKPSNCIVYSIGSKSNYVFEKGLIERFNCEIHVFDPFLVESTERSLHAGIHLHSWGVDSESHDVLRRRRNGTTTTLQMKSLPDIVSALGHEGLIIDILKIDVEGFEVGILNDPGMWGQLKNISTEFSQVLAEIHLSGINRETFLWQNSSLYDGSQIDMLFREMTSQGYGLFHKEINALPVARMQCAEFGFVKINVDCKDLVSRPQSKFVYSPSLTAI